MASSSPSSRSSSIPSSPASTSKVLESPTTSEINATSTPPSQITPQETSVKTKDMTATPRRGRQFVARASRLDPERMAQDDMVVFRGFFVLFWTSVSLLALRTVYNNLKHSGTPLGLAIFWNLYDHTLSLAKVDLAMAASVCVAPALAFLLHFLRIPHALSNSRVPGPGSLTQHLIQASWFAYWLSVAWHENWSWIQSGIFTLHLISMLFKMHSYLAVTGALRDLYIKTKSALPKTEPQNYYYPSSLTLRNFLEYLFFPTLVYELEYPRTPKVRVAYVVKRIGATFATAFLIYLILEHHVIPVLVKIPEMTPLDAVIELLFPFLMCWLFFFFIIFECVCNGMAELTRFADRNFYDDWWNSSSFDQFARKWNKPVHEFLLRHVYLESIETHGVTKMNATYITFFFSSLLHELVMLMIAKKVRFYLFLMQMFQIPLILLGSLPWAKRNPVLGNVFFWFSISCGPPLLAIAYCWEFYRSPSKI